MAFLLLRIDEVVSDVKMREKQKPSNKFQDNKEWKLSKMLGTDDLGTTTTCTLI